MTTFLTLGLLRENPIHRIKSYVGSGSGSGTGSIITDADPRIRIQIKMIWIRNTGCFDVARYSNLKTNL